jgi:hypothetical protein
MARNAGLPTKALPTQQGKKRFVQAAGTAVRIVRLFPVQGLGSTLYWWDRANEAAGP